MLTLKTMRRSKLVAWLPALLAIAATVVTAAGISLIPVATADTTEVRGTVTGSINFTSCAAQTNFASNFTTTGSGGQVSPACAMSFNTNNAAGGKITIADSDGSAPFFCTGACTAATDLAFENVGAGGKIDATAGMDDKFGFTVTDVSGNGSPASDLNTPTASPSTGSAIWYPVGTEQTICHSTASTTGTNCAIKFGAEPSGSQQAGLYTGTALLTAATL